MSLLRTTAYHVACTNKCQFYIVPIKKLRLVLFGGAHTPDENVCPLVKRTMVDVFNGWMAEAKKQESERKQQTVLHNVRRC